MRRTLHEASIVGRLAARRLRERLGGRRTALPDAAAWRAQLEPWASSVATAGGGTSRFLDLPANRPPWTDTGIDLEPGQSVSAFATGRVYLSRLLDVWVGPSFQLWFRVGEQGPVFRGTRDTHTFEAARGGRLWIASYFPGEWADPDGRLGTDPREYARAEGGLSALLVRWPRGRDIAGLYAAWARDPHAPGPVRAEAERLAGAVTPPESWEYLWLLGPGEIYRPTVTPQGQPAIACDTHGDVGILRREARMPLSADLVLDWAWRVDELPADLPEDTLPSHDYLSIAVEFDDGQDLTYYWSAALPEGTVYRCPLPTWRDRETHVVVRSGPAGLGRWHDERRNLADDYARIIGGQARQAVRIWLIANSLFQRGHGRCEYASIRLTTNERTLGVL